MSRRSQSRRIASSTIGLVQRLVGEQSQLAASTIADPDLTIARYIQGGSPGQTGTTFGAGALSVAHALLEQRRGRDST